MTNKERQEERLKVQDIYDNKELVEVIMRYKNKEKFLKYLFEDLNKCGVDMIEYFRNYLLGDK